MCNIIDPTVCLALHTLLLLKVDDTNSMGKHDAFTDA